MFDFGKLNIDEYARYLLTATVLVLGGFWTLSARTDLTKLLPFIGTNSVAFGFTFILAGYLAYTFYRSVVYELGIIRLKDWINKDKRRTYRTIIRDIAAQCAGALDCPRDALPFTIPLRSPDAERLYRLFPTPSGGASDIKHLQPISTGIHLFYWFAIIVFLSSAVRWVMGVASVTPTLSPASPFFSSWASASGCVVGLLLFLLALVIDAQNEETETLAFGRHLEQFRGWLVTGLMSFSDAQSLLRRIA